MASDQQGVTLDFIREHADDDVRELALRGARIPGIDLPFALDQISGRQKARLKLPSWAALDGIVYPPHLSMEQCSSEATARYKAGIVTRRCPDGLFVDLTGGFGVDFAFLARGFRKAVYVERQSRLCAISSENFKTLGLENADVVCADGTDYLQALVHADLLFVDPARRDSHGGRTYGIADCTPNLIELKDAMKSKADCLLIKLSPMLDWRKAAADIGDVAEVHIVSVDNECKELLLLVDSGKRDAESGKRDAEREMIRVSCVNLLSDGTAQRFEFDASAHQSSNHSSLHLPLSSFHFLFEPNASVMKAGCFGPLAERFGVSQPDGNSHLFLSDKDVADFPGRRFAIVQATSMNKRELKAALTGIDRANIAVRNFPMTVEQLRKKLKLKDGGDTYIFATTVGRERHQLFICRKIG